MSHDYSLIHYPTFILWVIYEIMVTRQPQHEAKQDQKTESDPRQSLTVLPSAFPSPYEPLSQHIDCTRLVRIEAATTDDDPIICSLFEVEFREKPKFHALSYMWGDGPAQCNIILNGVTFSVRQNLGDGLRYLRTHAADTSYWIDAICINQDDVLERNRQVRMMHHIYFRAETVVVWLGKRYAEYEASLPDLHGIGDCKPSNGQQKLESSADGPQSDLSAAKDPNEDAQQRKLAEDLYNNGYWNRLWIIQEIGRAHNIKVCFGNYAVEWDPFIHFITMHNIGSHGPVRLNRQRQGKYTGSSSLLQLLQDHREALCQDNKDKVYGLIGLASDAGGFVIDYQKSTFEIWTDVMEFMNRHGLFADKDIVYVGGLVKSLLMGANCLPLQQILRQYAPGKGDSMILTDPKHFKAFELQAAMLGCVTCVGPSPHEIVGNLNKVDEWTKQVQSNYKNDLGPAHQENDLLIRTILGLDDSILSKKCFDCRSVIQWSVRDDDTDCNEALYYNSQSIRDLQSRSSGQPQNENTSAEQSSTENSRLFQMLDLYKGRTHWKMGLASSDIRSGDFICWLGWPRRAVVVRPQKRDILHFWKLQVVGTAVVTEDLRESCLSCLQRVGWLENKLRQTIYLDATTIFILLA
uniref:Heterokaryon incompatibility domain-containing protein n=1 Tax=Bionectria ochroleuca TaxID=29856 RepID=A0A8H7NI33_BIOOC